MSKRTILYIDDNSADRQLLVEALRHTGSPYQVLPVDDPDSGVKAARLYRPAVVLLDLNMPTRSGEDVLRDLKADAWTREIPVIVFSADHDPRRAMELRTMGAAEYLVKPAGLLELAADVTEAVRRQLED